MHGRGYIFILFIVLCLLALPLPLFSQVVAEQQPEEPAMRLELGASVVSARAEPVVVVGDTVVYNSAAFRVAEDADLSELLKKIPGIQIDARDNVTLNGKPVKKLLVDGKKYFGGDVKTGLKNLSADMVDKVKAYEMESDFTRMTGIDDGEEEPVLDLKLKKEVKGKWRNTVNAGLGSAVCDGVPLPEALRYSLRANSGKMTDNSQLNMVMNANNTPAKSSSTNTSRNQMGSGGSGNRNLGEAGVTFSRVRKDLEIGGNIKYDANDHDALYRNRSQSIQPNKLVVDKSVSPYDTTVVTPINYSNSNASNFTVNHGVKGDFELEWKPDKLNTLFFKPEFSFDYSDALYHSRGMTFNEDPYLSVPDPLIYVTDATAANPLAAFRVNSSDNMSRNYTLRYSIRAALQYTRRSASKRGRSISARIWGGWYVTDTDNFQDYNTRYYRIKSNPDSLLVRRHYVDNDTRTVNLMPQLSWSEPLAKHWHFQLLYRYEYKHSSSDKSFYRFDKDYPQYSISTARRMNPGKMRAELPEDYMDRYYPGFSSSGDYYFHAHVVQLNCRYSTKIFNLTAGVTLKPQNTILKYPGEDGLETTRNFVFNAAPNISLKYNPRKSTQLSLTYRTSSSNPSVSNMIPIPSGTNPLYISIGNPNLKPPFVQTANLSFNDSNLKKHQSFNVELQFRTVQNEIVTSSQYDHETGVRTSTPMNINGSWSLNGNFSCTKTFRNSHFSLNNQTSAEYRNNLSYLYNSRIKADEVNKVRRLMVREILDGSYRNYWLELILTLSADYTMERSLLRPILNQDPISLASGLSAVFTFPWKMRLDTQFTFMMQRGYSYSELNRNYYLLNAELSQPLMKGKCTIRLGAYDILNSQENLISSFSTSSRSVSIYNGISRYLMLSFRYRF